MKNATFIRNFIIFSLVLAGCVIGLGVYTIEANREIKQSDNWVTHSQAIIVETQQTLTMVQTMLSAQRGYLLSGNPKFLEIYETSKQSVSNHLATLGTLTKDNSSQQSRLRELQHYVLQFSDALEGTMRVYKLPVGARLTEQQLSVSMREDILRLGDGVLNEEYDLLNKRANLMNLKTERYQMTLIIGAAIGAILLLIFNAFLLQAQAGRNEAEQNLQDTEERFRLAVRGSNDGIFDWNVVTNEIYWSAQYKAMLGYAEDELKPSVEIFKSMLNPEDNDQFWQAFDNYINGSLSEFSSIFRMKHKSGRWVWIHGRAKAIFDEEGRPQRFIGAHSDITHIKEYERKLEEEKDRAQKANEAKGEFLAHMSHEIRTPLTAISGIAEIFDQTMTKVDEKQRKLIKTLRASTESLKELITDILDFSKIESGEIELESKEFLLTELFEQVISIMSMKANEKKLDFTFDYTPLRGYVYQGDKSRIRQILINLIGNAIKFTDTGFVRIKAYKEMVEGKIETLRIDVSDSGIGINDKVIDQIFERFRQADSTVSRRYGGTGLGLPISKNLAELMGGVIKIESVEGRGSTFSLFLPLQVVGTSEGGDPAESTPQNQKIRGRLKEIMEGKKRILLVEDYEGNIVVLTYILESLDCAYDIARTGVEAIHRWKDNYYDLILMDVQMPEMDGLTATKTIRKLEEEGNIASTPIIGLTAHALVADKQKCIESGMNDYLSKPIVEEDLIAAILKNLETK